MRVTGRSIWAGILYIYQSNLDKLWVFFILPNSGGWSWVETVIKISKRNFAELNYLVDCFENSFILENVY